jgi:hypothetical protein
MRLWATVSLIAATAVLLLYRWLAESLERAVKEAFR